jgi:hypothetical protein
MSLGAEDARPKRLFELLLVVAALSETFHLIALYERRAEVDGTLMAVIFTAGLPWVPVLLGLAVTRRRSAIAKWLLSILIAVAAYTAFRIGTARWGELAMLFGALAGALQLTAAIVLLTVGRTWTGARPLRNAPRAT